MWAVPLLNVLHVESAAALAGLAFFTAAVTAVRLLERGFRTVTVVAFHLAALLFPLALLTLSMAWTPNCSYATGLMFFGLFPVVSVLLATALAGFVHAARFKRPVLIVILTGMALAVLPPLYDVGLHPQLYAYNHVFGGVLGPLYDEELAIRRGLFHFRVFSLLWAALLFVAAALARAEGTARKFRVGLAAGLSVAIAAAYVSSVPLGWNTTRQQIGDALGATHKTNHFEIYYDERSVREGEIDLMAEEMEFRYQQVTTTLETVVDQPILVYLYPTASIKGALTGSRYTSVTPVWLHPPQIHMLLRRFDRSFDHELVHVVAREFGMPLLRASVSVGLVEGLAGALEAPDGQPSADEMMAAVAVDGTRDSTAIVDGLVSAINPLGFWTGRGAVSYTATASFVHYLLQRDGPGTFKKAYRSSNISKAYGRPAKNLAAAWYRSLLDTEFIPVSARPTAERAFAIPSLFEATCPHTVPAHVRANRDGADHLALHDTLSAMTAFETSIDLSPDFYPAVAALAALRLRTGDFEAVRALIPADSVTFAYPALAVLYGDAHAMAGDGSLAVAAYDSALAATPDYLTEIRSLVLLRRHIAMDAESVRWLLGPGEDDPPPSIFRDPLFPMYGIMRASRRRHFEAACAAGNPSVQVAETSDFASADLASLLRQAHLWRAAACESADLLNEAAAAYENAYHAFGSVGSVEIARMAHDGRQRVQWKLSKRDRRRSPTHPSDREPGTSS